MRYEFFPLGVSLLLALAGAVIGCRGGGEKAGGDPEVAPDFQPAEPESPLPDPDEVATILDRPAGPGRPVDAGRGLYQREYLTPPDFLSESPAGGQPGRDPFSSPLPDPSGDRSRRTARSVLEAHGIHLGEGSHVEYDSLDRRLRVIANRRELDLVDALFAAWSNDQPKLINVRIEIFEMPASTVLELQRSAGNRADHTAEWEEVLGVAVESGNGARFVTAVTHQCRSGHRSRFEAVDERIFVHRYSWNADETGARLVPSFDTRRVGTVLECDPVLGADGVTIDFGIDFEHHTAPPTSVMETVRFPDSGESFEVEMTRFHAAKIDSEFSMRPGQVKLIGAWRLTGLDGREKGDPMQIAFMMADIQPLVQIGRIR